MQLSYLNEFWKLKENSNQKWSANEFIQKSYYNYLKEQGFLEGKAARKAKDARQKTSGLVDIGLIDNERRLTGAGKKLLELSLKHDFETDNFLQIPKDSYIYFLQLLKTSICIDGNYIRPFILLCRLLSKFKYLTWKEFVYFFPLCSNEKTTEKVEKLIQKERNSEIKIDDVIIKVFMDMDNYKNALSYFLNEKNPSKETFSIIGMNRKSKDYDLKYYPLYKALENYYVNNKNTNTDIIRIFENSDLPNVSTYWRKLLFDTSSSAAIKKSPLEHLRGNIFSNCSDINKFKTNFFMMMHLYKAKASLEDYSDLNRRYLKITDTILFEDNSVKFDILPKAFFVNVKDEFYTLAFKPESQLFKFTDLETISPLLKISEDKLLSSLSKENGIKIIDTSQAKQFVKDKRYERFNKLIDDNFSISQLVLILNLFKKRQDKEIQKLVSDSADAPTIFEYILAIAWYQISERKGDILSFMNLSLEADLLPKTHAGGGEADIVYKYEQTEFYPKHDLLIEATLADSTNQRKMEMEPVSRHLGDYLLKHKGLQAYCVFITNFLHINVISDFWGRRSNPYYDNKNNEIDGMNIIPIDTDLLVKVLEKGLKYQQIYSFFMKMNDSTQKPKEWYQEIQEGIEKMVQM